METYLDCNCVDIKLKLETDKICKVTQQKNHTFKWKNVINKHECVCDIIDQFFYDAKGVECISQVLNYPCLSDTHECICSIDTQQICLSRVHKCVCKINPQLCKHNQHTCICKYNNVKQYNIKCRTCDIQDKQNIQCCICYQQTDVYSICKNKHQEYICEKCINVMMNNHDYKCPICRENLICQI